MPGLELNRRFYQEAVRPLMAQHFNNLKYAAARLGPGSDVLGFDTPMSMDHDWGPKLLLFLPAAEMDQARAVEHMLGMELPVEFLGFATAFTPPNHEGTAVMQVDFTRPINHGVRVTTVQDFAWRQLGWEISQPVDPSGWLSVSSQALREVTAGAVYHDGFGELNSLRRQLNWYPQDIWLYLLACCWQRIGQEDHLMPRAGYVGDELGSRLIGARLVRDIMTLCFLMEKDYPPYPKWFGSAFRRLGCAAEMEPILQQVLEAPTWQERQIGLVEACRLTARLHNSLGITQPLSEEAHAFYDRPFKVIGNERFVEALLAQISDPAVKAVARLGLIGSVDLFSDSTDLRTHKKWQPRLRQMITPENPPGD